MQDIQGVERGWRLLSESNLINNKIMIFLLLKSKIILQLLEFKLVQCQFEPVELETISNDDLFN